MRRAKRKTTVPPRPKVTARVNEQIAAQRVRVVDEDGTQVGVLPLADARQYATQRSLDLIEVAVEADPPVCRVGDYGRWRYEEERRLRAGRRQQVHLPPKEVRLRPRIEQAAEHRIAIDPRLARPNHSGGAVDQRADLAIADRPQVEVAHAAARSQSATASTESSR